ncbi:hypothetical protein O0I10_001911 [Lichtheimia ornata]|uniref:Uncharacterized protein n=1 Tax=Lichtheimia ornata TaxID=688661 RepID=A0AAD7VBM7_9FUNG|nr:uncharacterized protein O0I10_001911 [Lichtheimia ornata]KAJ8662218.1 hypothetical protein O0I10_001911 [Lichtheimia ornata]
MDSSALGRLDQRVEQLLSSMQQTTNDLRDMRASLLHRSRILYDMVDTLESMRDSTQSDDQPARTSDNGNT